MKQYLMPILAAILVLILVPLIGCSESERDKAVTFYEESYPIGNEIRQVTDDWNAFLQRFSQGNATNQEILKKSQEHTVRFEALAQDLSMLYAPPPLRQLKDDMASALNLGIGAFALYKLGAETYSISCFLEADQKLLECNRLMMRVADEWDDGLSHHTCCGSL